MAIQYFCGRPGSGKSYGVIENVLIPALKLNRPIYTNIPLNIGAIAEDYPESYGNITVFSNDDLNGPNGAGDFLMQIIGGAVIIIDECWRWWAAGARVNDIPMLDKEFFAEHRHKVGLDGLTQEIVLISQAPSQIAKYLRDLIDQTVLTIKNTAAGSEKTFTVQIFSGCIPSIDKTGEPQTNGLGRYKSNIYKYYKSHTKSETGLAGVEIRADKRLNVWSHWYIRYVAPLILISAIWGAYTLYHIFADKKAASAPVSVPVQPVQAFNDPQAKPLPDKQSSPAPAPVQPVYSTRYRIAGLIAFDGKIKVYVHDAQSPHLRIYDQTQCKTNDFNVAECKIDNEIVTIHTGTRKEPKQENQFGSMVPTVAAVSENVHS